MSGSITLSRGAEVCHLPARWTLRHGGELHGPVLAFERQGPADAPTVLVLGGIGAGRHVSAHAAAPAPGWWQGFVGAGCAVDTDAVQVLAIDWIGGAGASTGPRGGEPFPLIDAADQADAVVQLLDHLGIAALHAVVGASYGGMVGLQLAARHGERLRRLCCLGAAHRPWPLATGWRAVQRGIVEFAQGHGDARRGLALARALAMATYRSGDEFAERFAAPPRLVAGAVHADVDDYLLARGQQFARHFEPAAFVGLSASIDAHAVAPATVLVPTTLVAFDRDQIVPPQLVAELAAALPRLERHVTISSRYGHDGFLKERAALQPVLREALR